MVEDDGGDHVDVGTVAYVNNVVVIEATSLKC